MAQRRMFSLKIVDSDAFLDMPQSSQLLYYHLSMRADDDGFIGNPKKIMRMVGSQDDDIKVLFTKRFLLPFESGIVVIKHWRIHNYIQNDRYSGTQYVDEKKRLKIKDNGAYTENVSKMDTQVRLGKDRLLSETEVSVNKKPLENNQDTMGNWNKKSDNDEDVISIDMDTREEIETDESKAERETKELNEKIRHNLKLFEPLRGISWGTGKDMNFHVKAYRELLHNGWSHESILSAFIEIVGQPHWKEKKEKGEYPGMNTVQFHLRNKKPI